MHLRRRLQVHFEDSPDHSTHRHTQTHTDTHTHASSAAGGVFLLSLKRRKSTRTHPAAADLSWDMSPSVARSAGWAASMSAEATGRPSARLICHHHTRRGAAGAQHGSRSSARGHARVRRLPCRPGAGKAPSHTCRATNIARTPPRSHRLPATQPSHDQWNYTDVLAFSSIPHILCMTVTLID